MARSMWSGMISFGMVNIPVKLMTAVRDHSVQLHMLSPDGKCRLRRKLYCPDTGQEYDFKDTARGYEIAPDQYVILREEELDNIRPEAGRTIEITQFIELEQIDPMYYDRTYWLTPDEHGTKAYQLLLRAMEEKDRVAIGRFVMRQKEYLAALRPHRGGIVLQTMHYADEIVDQEEELDLPGDQGVDKKQLRMAEQLIESLSEPFEPSRYTDEYREKLMEMIEAKAEGEETVTHEATAEEAPAPINLMEALEKSLASAKKAGGGGRRRKSA